TFTGWSRCVDSGEVLRSLSQVEQRPVPPELRMPSQELHDPPICVGQAKGSPAAPLVDVALPTSSPQSEEASSGYIASMIPIIAGPQLHS
ncbi:MAG: hypothetical protein WB773_10385, partial [Isosphaeraceae bacterium]